MGDRCSVIITLKILINSKPSLESLVKEKGLPTKLKYQLSKMMVSINAEYDLYFKSVKEVKEKFELTDELIMSALTPDTQKRISECDKELQILSESIAVEIPIDGKIAINELGETKELTAADLFELNWLIGD